jgi:hypothetical protein
MTARDKLRDETNVTLRVAANGIHRTIENILSASFVVLYYEKMILMWF